MNDDRRRGYSYEGIDGFRTRQKKGRQRRKIGRILVPVILLIAAVAAGYMYLPSNPLDRVIGSLPLPKQLVGVKFEWNGQELLLPPDGSKVLNPRDTLSLIGIVTDGWVSWGAKVVSPELDLKVLKGRTLNVRDLYPGDSFEMPKTIDVQAFLWNRPIGRMTLKIQLDSKDWSDRADAAVDVDRKIYCLERALVEAPGNILFKSQLAGLYFETKKYEEAAKLYREIDGSGRTVQVLERLLSIYQYQQKVDDALGVYLELVNLTEEPDHFKEMLQYLQKKKSKEESGRFLEKHIADIPKGFHNAVLLYLAEVSAQNKNWSKAAATYEKLIKSGEKDPTVLYNLAVTYQQNEDLDKAIQAMERYLQKNPGDAKSWMQLADLQEQKGALGPARNTYETILKKNPHNKEALTRLIAILEKGNDKAALLSAYERMAQLQPKNKTLQFNMAVLYYEAKKFDKAAEYFQSVAALDGSDVESRKYLLYIYRNNKDAKREAAMLKALAQLDPKNASYQDSIFKSFEEKKDYKGMIAYFKQLSAQQPNAVFPHNYMLHGYLQLKDNKNALIELEALIRLEPKEKKHLRRSANLYEETKNYGEAAKKLDQLLKLDPKNKEAKDDYLRLRTLEMSTKKKGK